MIRAVKEFKAIKGFLDRNAQWIGVSFEVLSKMDSFQELLPEKQNELQFSKSKALDCKVVHLLLQDLRR